MRRRKKLVAAAGDLPYLDSSLVARAGALRGPNARARGGTANSPTPSDTALEVLIDHILEFVLASGFESDRIASELEERARRLRMEPHQVRRREIPEYEVLHHLSGMLHDWFRDPLYTDEQGRPKPIPLQGRPPSIEHLIRQRMHRTDVEAVLTWLDKVQLFERNEEELCLPPRSRSMIVGGEGLLRTERIATLVTQFLSTALHNASRAAQPREINFDRAAHVPRLSAEHLPAFRRFVAEQGQVFLEAIDNWLEDHPPAADEAGVAAGAHLYMYSRDLQSRSRSGRRIRPSTRKKRHD